MSMVTSKVGQIRTVLRVYRYDLVAVYITGDDSCTPEVAKWTVLTKGQRARKYHTGRQGAGA